MLPKTGVPSTRRALPSLVCVTSIVSPSASTLATLMRRAETAQSRSVCRTACTRYGGVSSPSTAWASGSSAALPFSSSTKSDPSGSVTKATSLPSTSGASAVTIASQRRARGGSPAPARAPAAVSYCRRKFRTGSTGAGGRAASSSSSGRSRPASRSKRSFRVSPRRKNRISRVLLRLDQAVAALAAAVDDVDLVRVGVAEHEEVVADQFELEHGFLGVHRLDCKLLRLDDLRFFGHLESFVGCLPAGATAPASLLAVAGDLALELVDELVDRGTDVLRALPSAQDGALRPHRCLGDVGVPDRRILLGRELEVDLGIGQLAFQLAEAFLGIRADRVGDLDPAALHAKLHGPNLPDDPRKSHDLDSAGPRFP